MSAPDQNMDEPNAIGMGPIRIMPPNSPVPFKEEISTPAETRTKPRITRVIPVLKIS